MKIERWIAIGLLLAISGCKTGQSDAGGSDAQHQDHGATRQAAPGPSPHAPGQVPGNGAGSPAPEVVELSRRDEVLADVATAKVVRKPFVSSITAAGLVTIDESRQRRITAWVDGRIQRLRVATTGAYIHKGQPVADIYSPDLVATQQELLLAVRSAKELAGSSIPEVADNARRMAESARQRLALWGLSAAQINAVIKANRPLTELPILAPVSGVVMKRMVQAGDWVDKGMTLYELVDLSHVWVEADVYEYELGGLQVGQSVNVEALAYPGRSFTGNVAFISPMMMAETRTNTLRVELANPQGLLKPGMTVTATAHIVGGVRLAVPADAVLDTGKRQLVWVQTAPRRFESRAVQVGRRTEDSVEILSGLREHETIATSGAFMLDATSQLRRGGGHAGHGPAPAAGKGSSPAPGMPEMNM